ncbi:unnamed protein product [Protopolystoma xenopodis]|uniref:Uncharacterized protein n=1 Tax=Protopolystoma xenopodis TaxID=117903 RepID=A0A3S5BCB8_9PLAT|nr:unnamed protein product [Protopolystoma xenopodis]
MKVLHQNVPDVVLEAARPKSVFETDFVVHAACESTDDSPALTPTDLPNMTSTCLVSVTASRQMHRPTTFKHKTLAVCPSVSLLVFV